jgi:class 3 adenylate cyclase
MIENGGLQMKDEMISRLQQLIKLYLPEAVVANYLNDPTSVMARESRQLAVMFTDIRSFARLSDGKSVKDLVQSLNNYFRIMADIIYANGGTIEKYIGDAILAYFGYPSYREETALQAVMAGIEMVDSGAASLGAYRTAIGISLGMVSIGNIGHPGRKLNFTILGDTVNLASRMECLTSTYRQNLLISESVYEKIRNAFPCRLVDNIAARDVGTFTKLFTTKKHLGQKEAAAWNSHNEGMRRFDEKDFKGAIKCFQTVLEHSENDYLAKMMVDRCVKNMRDE